MIHFIFIQLTSGKLTIKDVRFGITVDYHEDDARLESENIYGFRFFANRNPKNSVYMCDITHDV